jgi:hypothetical protein
MFRSGLEIILVTAASETPTDFALKVNQFKSNLVGPYVVALTPKTVELMDDLAQLGANYFVPSGSVSKSWMVDTLQSVYSVTTRRYRIKVYLIYIIYLNDLKLNYIFYRWMKGRLNFKVVGTMEAFEWIHQQLLASFFHSTV